MRTKSKRKDFHVRIDVEVAEKLLTEAKRDDSTVPRTIARIVSNHFHPRRP